MECECVVFGNELKAILDGEIDHHTAKGIREQIDEAIIENEPQHLILDFKKVSFMDSSGIGLVMGRYRAMDEIGGDLVIEGLSTGIKKVMKLAGMDRLAQIKD